MNMRGGFPPPALVLCLVDSCAGDLLDDGRTTAKTQRPLRPLAARLGGLDIEAQGIGGFLAQFWGCQRATGCRALCGAQQERAAECRRAQRFKPVRHRRATRGMCADWDSAKDVGRGENRVGRGRFLFWISNCIHADLVSGEGVGRETERIEFEAPRLSVSIQISS